MTAINGSGDAHGGIAGAINALRSRSSERLEDVALALRADPRALLAGIKR
ncbi:MAG: hypothetical protein ACK4TK_02455 [Thiobacillaceae bacterium]